MQQLMSDRSWTSNTKLVTRPCVGVRLSDGSEIRADLVIDASGRFSHLPQWLEAAGLSKPPIKRVNAGKVYVSRIYKVAGLYSGCLLFKFDLLSINILAASSAYTL